MTSLDLLRMLANAAMATGAAALLLMVVVRPMRRWFGAGVAYAAWWLLPFVLIASLLPARTVEISAPLAEVPMAVAAPASVASPLSWAPLLAVLWLCGALAMALHLWRQQRRFERGLGRLRALRDDLWLAQSHAGLPALLGVLHARIVLPGDFALRYDPRERSLMLAHEREHRRRGDHLANFVVAALRCLFWFNPLVHLAARSFRHDQELACDQAVIAAHPDSRRAYGEAMLKNLMADRQAPLGCHWGFSHPLKERVMQLKLPMPRPRARRLGAVVVLVCAFGAGFAAWSAQPPRYVAQPRAEAPAADAGLRLDDARHTIAAPATPATAPRAQPTATPLVAWSGPDAIAPPPPPPPPAPPAPPPPAPKHPQIHGAGQLAPAPPAPHAPDAPPPPPAPPAPPSFSKGVPAVAPPAVRTAIAPRAEQDAMRMARAGARRDAAAAKQAAAAAAADAERSAAASARASAAREAADAQRAAVVARTAHQAAVEAEAAAQASKRD